MLESGFFYGNFIDSFLNPLRKKVAMKIPPGQKIIDIACGTGAQSFALADKSNEVVGIDLSESMIRFARRKKDKMKQNNVQFLIADASDLSIFKYHSFDVAIMSLALHQFNPELYLPVLSEMKRLSKTILILDYAVPLPCNIYGKISQAAEFLAGREHYHCFRAYYKNGGLNQILPVYGILIAESVFFAEGAFHLAICSPVTGN